MTALVDPTSLGPDGIVLAVVPYSFDVTVGDVGPTLGWGRSWRWPRPRMPQTTDHHVWHHDHAGDTHHPGDAAPRRLTWPGDAVRR